VTVNKRWHRADLEISPVGCLVLVAIALLIVVLVLLATS